MPKLWITRPIPLPVLAALLLAGLVTLFVPREDAPDTSREEMSRKTGSEASPLR